MGFFTLLGKGETETSAKTADWEGLDVYSGMRVEVTTDEGQPLFMARFFWLRGNKGKLHQYSEFEMKQDMEPIRVNIRGYSDYVRKVVYMKGVIASGANPIWEVEELSVVRSGNDRAFFRLDTNIDATVTMFTGLEIGEKPCRLVNVSAGGVCFESQYRYHKSDTLLLKFKLLEDSQMSVAYCKIVRVTEKGEKNSEYGCEFLELTEDARTELAKDIFAIQCKMRASQK